MAIDIKVLGADPEDLRYDGRKDHAEELAEDIHQLLDENYSYLDVDNVSTVVGTVLPDEAADFPEGDDDEE